MEGIIYKYTNKLNGKIYIGQTLDEAKRMRDHRYCKGKNVYFHNAIRKYGFENFDYEVLFRDQFDNVNDAKIVLDDRERQFILDYMSWDPDKGYNLTNGGGGAGGYKHTEDHKKRISIKLKGVSRPQEVVEKIKATRKKRPVYVDGVRFESVMEASKFLGCLRQSIHSAIRQNSKIYGHIVSWEG